MRRPLNKNLFLIGKLLAVGCWLVVFAWCALVMRHSPWTGIRTLTADGSAIIDGVDAGSPADRAGLQVGDAILSVQGERLPWQAFEPDRDMLPEWGDDDAHEAGKSRLVELVKVGQKMSIQVRRGGKVVDVSMLPEPMPFSATLRRTLWVNLLALAWMVAALLIVRKLRSIQTAGILIVSTFVALTMTTMGTVMGRELATSPDAIRWLHLVNLISSTAQALSAAWWAMVFPARSKWASWLIDRSWLFIVLGAVTVAAHQARLSPAPIYLTYGINGLGNLAFLLILTVNLGTSTHAVHRRQMQWMLLGCMLGTLPYVLLTEVPLLMGWPVISQAITCQASIAIPITIGFAIHRWKLLEISGLFDEGLWRWGAILALGFVSWGGIAYVSWFWKNSASLPFLQGAALLVLFAGWNLANRFMKRRARRAPLGMDALPPLIERLVRGEPLPDALAAFLSLAYRTRIFALLGPGNEAYADAESGARWISQNQGQVREVLTANRGVMLGFELAWKLGVEVPADVENCLFLEVPREGEVAALLALGPRWSPDWWTSRDVERIRSLMKIALPLGAAAEVWHREELGKRAALEHAREVLETKVRERTQDVEAVNQQLRQALSAREDFLAQMSHELRSPLAVILGGVEAIQEGMDGQTTPFMNKRLAMVERNGLHLLSLIQDILDFTRGRAGKLPIQLEACRIGTQIDLAIELVGPLLAEKTESVHLRYDEDLRNAVVSADPIRLRQILTNLLSNALHHGRGGVEVHLEASGGRLRVHVLDRGAGVPLEFVERLFKPFERFGALAGHRASTGLGLALSRQLAQGMGAVLEYSPRVGGGADFCLDLPRDAGTPMESIENAPPESGVRVMHRSVLVVDDQRDLLELWSSYFESLGWSVATAGCVEDALESVERSLPDAILTDLGLPGLDGCELVSRVRALPGGERVAIFVLTGAAMPEDQERSLASGADLYRVKPVLLSDVANRITALVQERRAP